MPNLDVEVELWDLVGVVSRVTELASERTARRHERAAYIALRVAERLGLPDRELATVVLAGALHDCGTLCLKQRLDGARPTAAGLSPSSHVGSVVLRSFAPFREAAGLVRFGRLPWRDGDGAEWMGEPVPREAHLLHVAARTAALAADTDNVLADRDGILETLRGEAGSLLDAGFVEALADTGQEECFWLDLTARGLAQRVHPRVHLPRVRLSEKTMLQFGTLFARMIDFRSSYTATHSSGVAKVASVIAAYAGMSERECARMALAGYAHDVGRVGIPAKVFETAGKLNAREFCAVRAHPYYTYGCLDTVAELSDVRDWAAFHHERLDGGGYPFHHHGRDLSLGARILAVADIVTATSEDRPHRPGLSRDETLGILNRQVAEGAVDGALVSLVVRNYDEVNEARARVQESARREYDQTFGIFDNRPPSS